MPNRASNVGHTPIRSCVICRKQKLQSELLYFKVRDGEIVFDFKRKLFGRGYYVCDDNNCIDRMEKWLKKMRKKKK